MHSGSTCGGKDCSRKPRDASWGERYFHMPDPDVVRAADLAVFEQVHELIFIEEKFLKIPSQHRCAEVLSWVRFVQ